MDNYKQREFIKLRALGFASLAMQFSSISSFAQMANAHYGKWTVATKLNWDAFLDRVTELSNQKSPDS